jgi:UDP-N-acetylglucosamine 2-epimerase (non-hydrolysing)
MNIVIIAGARPNFMKIAPIIHAIQKSDSGTLSFKLVHTGQHFDHKMSESFFTELSIPKPDVNLECGGGTQAEQTANIMVRFEQYLAKNKFDLVIVVGDVTSTMACSIVAKKMGLKLAHVEAGIRSGDLTMPEEVNRIVTDSLTDYFFTTSETANNNLKKAGIGEERIFLVGNTMIDTLLVQQTKFRKPSFWDVNRLNEKGYIVLTLHRPANVDSEENLSALLDEIIKSVADLKIVFAVHPRTASKLRQIKFDESKVVLTEPLGYLEFNYLVQNAKAVITDSGGITEETTVLNVPCLTLRNNTERPETVTIGTNELIGTNPQNIAPAMEKVLSDKWKKGKIPPFWDGKTAERIVNILEKL